MPVLLGLAAAPAAGHAIRLSTSPPDGSVLGSAPKEVTVTFSNSIRPGPRNAVIRNSNGADVTAGEPTIRDRRTLVIPLRADLEDGVYTARWNIVSDDGHSQEGVLAFAIGEGSGPPVPALGTRGFVTWQQVVMRTTFLLGVLVAAGSAFFAFVILRPLEPGRDALRRHAHLLFGGFVLAFVGADALINETAGGGTRFERVLWVAAVASFVGAAAAALAPRIRPLLWVAWAAACVLVACPPLAGHALDPDQPTVVAPLADLIHLGAGAVWLGGLASLVLVAGRSPDAERREAARSFSALAIPLVLVLAIAGLARALTELSSVSQLWTTGYGQTILVKTGLFGALLAVAWRSRAALAERFSRLRRLVLVELVLLLAVVVAVGLLTTLQPGRAQGLAPGATPARPVVPPPPTPPPGAYVDAAQAGRLAVGFAWRRGEAIVTLTGPSGGGVADVPVAIEGGPSRSCGSGCFSRIVSDREVDVRVGTTDLRFEVPAKLVAAAAELDRVTGIYEGLAGVTIHERIASGSGLVQVTLFHLRAPDRMAYRIVGGSVASRVGTEGIVIGDRRWDRLPGGDWVASTQTPIRVPQPSWTSAARNAFATGPGELTFHDPTLAAWFRLRYDPATGRMLELEMTAADHFMVHRYSGFDRPVPVSPPSR